VVLGALCGKQVVEREEHEDRQIRRSKADIDHELQEVLEVAVSDTVIDPRAMMVHPEHAEPALGAVVRTGWFPSLFLSAAMTLLAVLDLHVLGLERRFHTLRQLAGVGETRAEVGNVGHQTKSVKCEEVKETTTSQWNAYIIRVSEFKAYPGRTGPLRKHGGASRRY